MDYQYIQKTIAHLQEAIHSLSELTPQSHDLTAIAVVDEVQEQLNKARAALSTAINPELPEHLPGDILQQMAEYGILIEDLEVRVALSLHHPSQILGVLSEINNRYSEIRRVREYFLVRLPQQPIEELGSRLPFCTATDFAFAPPPTPPAVLESLKNKYQLHKLKKRSPANAFFGKIDAAQQAWEQAKQSVDPK
jgi:hypothetical protein